ncbi:endonuclease [Cupriavidus sp. USMAA2-4]|uniref:Endonuclease n=1 Tax=Cupriavidus malaysiensis TaxID=367825 RepID=A0ABN4TNK3_9BURK|nr:MULTISPECIES: DNA/RNA non-specific endonuclease [Cupriavidus]AOY93759.1 endonuclease [Cupriavidus sp. USMAA2-4]AOY99951.1 endonuclease [Cupriavidus sp. USMAHM13]AOZ06578.1 endonuclease [Cupriavidus malaysiensis]
MHRIFRLAASTALFLGITTAAHAAADFAGCQQFFAQGAVPQLHKAQNLKPRALCFDSFAILHSGTTKTPVYVAERINAAQVEDAQDEQRTNRFFADARLPRAERAELDDYKGSGYDRGHMAPAGDMPSATAMAQSFSLANMVPQAPQNNRRSWAGIEQATRKYARRAKGDIYVITGPVYGSTPSTIGPGQVWVPQYLFKLVYDPSNHRAWAHWIENTDSARAGRPISYQELVKRTGIEFLPGVTLTE